MANINQLIANAVRGDLLPSGDTPSVNDGNPYNNPNYVEPPSDPNDLGEVYNGPAAPDTGWTPPVITKSNNLANNTQSKQSTVAATAAAKQQALMTPAEFYNNSIAMETGQGRATASQMEQDLRDLTPAGIYQKYGVDVGSQLISGQAEGNRQSLIDQTRGTRTATEMWDDFNVEFGQGLGNALGGVAGLAAAPISEDAGTGIASLMGDFNKFMDSSKSDRLTARKNLMEGKQALDMRDNAAQQQKDIEESGKTVAGLKRFGRDLVDTLGNATSDSATLGAGISNALGSLVAAGPVAKGLSAVSKGRLGITASIAATEAGGAYNQVTDEVLKRSFDDLSKESPMFNELVASGVSPEDARITVANRTGMLAGAITAPAAALAGRLVHKFEANPLGFGSGGIKQALGSIGRETVEESTQSLTGQLAQNFAEQQIANTNKDLSEGVGRATAEGGLYGMGMSAVLAGPGIARSAAGKAVSAIAERAAGVDEANKKASPVADETVAAADAEVQAAAPVAESVLREAAGTDAPTNAYVDTLMSATKFEPTEAPAQFQEAVGDVTSRVGAIQRMAEVVNSAPEGSPEQLRAGHYLNSLVQDFTEVINTDPAALSALPADNPASQIVAQYQGLMGAVQNSPKVMAALEAVWAAAENAEPVKATVDAQTLATPEGQQDVADVIGNAEIAPEKGDLGTTEQVLYQIEQGNLNVTPRQKAALDTSVALLRAVQAADIEAQRTGTTDPVSLNISSVDGEKGKSVTQHAKGIMSAWKSGDRELAADRLTDLATFAEGMANKVDALNTHFAAGDPKADGLRYGITVNGVPQMSKTKMAARVNTQGGVEFAQKVAREAKMLADVYNGLVEAFPDLGGEHLNVAPLAAELVGPAAEVAARYSKPVVATEDNPVAPATKTESQPAASVEDSIESAAASLQQKVEDAFASENAEFLALDSNTSITEAQRDRLSELDSLLYTISGVEEIAQGVSVSKAAMETLSTVLPTNLFEELKTTRTQAIQQRNAAKPQPAAPVAKPAPTQKVEAKPATVKAESAIADRNGYVQSIADKVVNLPDGSKLYEPDTDTTVTIQHTVSPNTGVKQTDVIGDNGKVRFSLVQNKDGTWKELGDAYLDSAIEPVVAEETVVEPTVEKTPVLKGIAAAFPTVAATFHKAFKLPSKQRTRTIGDEAPVNTIRSALKDSASLTAFIGSSIKGDYTKEIATAYAGYLGMAENFHGELDDRLQAFLDQPYSKGNPTTMGQILSGEKEVLTGKGVVFDPLRTPQGKALGITETINGEIVYNPELSQMAVLAGMQWFLSADQYGVTMDAKDIAESFGLNEGALDDTVVDLLNQGMGLEEAVQSLGSKIRGYWGVTPDSNGSRGYTEGIPEGVAKEVISVMLNAGWLTQETVTLTEKDGLPAGEVRTPVRIIPTHKIRDENNKLPNDPLADVRDFPAAIEQAVLLEPEDIKFIGEDSLPPVAKEQLRNAGVANTAQQQEMMAKEQATPYFVQPHMAGLYMALGRDAILRMFGAGDIDKQSMNKNHAESMEGVNRSTVAAFDHLQNLLGEIANHGEIDQTPTRYAVNMVRVNRMQMLGKYNPQSNKLVREAILPTGSTLDLSSQTGQDYKRYALGLAQLLDVKVHKLMPAISRANVEAVLSGPLAPAVEALQNWNKGFDNSQINNPSPMSSAVVDILVDAFAAAKKPLNPMSLHAVMDYARYLNTEDKSAFNTSVYLEADGMTNGPIMAMMLFTVGAFKASWLRNIAKGGVFINRPDESANSYNTQQDSNDLYQATTDELKGYLQTIRDNYASDAKVIGQLDSLFYLMDEFLGGDLQFSRAADGTPQLTLQRGIAKNPLTITIYGSGAGGIAAKMTKIVMDSVYERMSQVAQARVADGNVSMAEAMFGAQSASLQEAEAKLARFENAFNKLTTNKAKQTQTGIKIDSTPVGNLTSIDPLEFTLSTDQWANMQSNMLQLFVDPMRSAITNTVGDELMATAETLRQATQAQSIVLEYAFKDAVEQALADKAKDPNWRPGDFLTIKEEADLRKKLEHLSPLVQTDTQNFYIAGSEKSDIKMTEFSRSLDGKLNTPANIAGPRDAGVSGIPFMNIGAGDGQTMQNMAVDPNGPTGTLKIFDGVNIPLDQIEDGSVSANKAALDAMLGNPLAAVHKSYSNFMSDAKLTDMSDAQRKALSKALFGLGSETMSEAEIVNAMTNLVGKLNVAQQSVEARCRVMRKSPLSIDQMAAANSPYQQQGTLAIVGTDFDAVAEQLTAHYYVELEQVQGEAAVRKMDEAFYDNGTLDDSGVVTMSGKDLLNAIDTLPENQKAVLTEVGNSLAAQDYTILLGTAEQVAEYNNSRGLTGLSSLPTGDVKGYTNVGLKQVVLLNPSSETFAHELLHAATYEAIDAHYGGETNDAVPRIEAMMEQFINQATELSHTSDQLNTAYNSALAAINGHLADGNKAAALNEYMAWTLANESLSRVAERTDVTKLARVKGKLIAALKSLLGIKADVGNDVFSNLLFNSAILMHAQVKLNKRFNQSILFQNSIYGQNDRLTRVNEALDKTIGRYLQEAPQSGRFDQQSALAQGIRNGMRVAESFMSSGFNMNMQEASTFRTIVASLATEAAIDPNAMAGVQQLYSHVMKNLKVESFMTDPTDDAARYYAGQKYDVLSGKMLVTQDIKGRSSLLPAFLALATVSEEFRAVLANMDLPKSAHNTAGTLDALLENTGNKFMDKLSARMAGQKKASNVVQALDQLNNHMADVINARETFIDQVASKGQGVLDRTNEIMVTGMNQLAGALLKNSKRAAKNASNKLDRTVSGIGAGVAALIDNTAAAGVAQDTMTVLNRSNAWSSVRDLIGDLVGRTASNANVYDMIKAVRSMVQRARQQYRENLPEILAAKFTRELTGDEKHSLHRSMGKTDLAALGSNAVELATDNTKRAAEITKLEKGLTPLHIKKAKQLANYMVNGIAGQNLLRNAEAVARLLGENQAVKTIPDVSQVDQLISLYAVEVLTQEDRDTLSTLAQDEAVGLNFSLDYMRGQRAEEQKKSTGMAKMNAFKGYIPNMLSDGMSMVVKNDSEYSELVKKSYERIADYTGSPLERGLNRGYYFIPVASRGSYEQGILQNVVQTAGGVNAATGLQVGQTAGAITEQADVKMLAKRMSRDNGVESLMPVYDEAGNISAFERALNPDIMARLYTGNDLLKTIGIWRGRQVEEGFATEYNTQLVQHLKSMFDKDNDPSQYVDVFNTKDPVLKDAVKLFSQETKAIVASIYGDDKFMVRKDMLNDAFGYRMASVGDIWTGNSRWSPETQKNVRNLAVSMMGNNAYKMLMNFEKGVQQVVSDAKVLIVVKSVIVPAVNMISNMYQLVSRGVPLNSIAKGMPKKLAEVEAYTKSLVRKIEAEAELRAAHGDIRLERKLKTEIQAINDDHRRMSIWPLIEAGEFSGISDAGLTRGDIELTSGRMQAYMESLVNKLPERAKNVGRYALVTKDTALYQGLQKAVEYGDFLGKAILYDDLTQRKGLTQAQALARITEEFVNYDRLTGRFRSSMEAFGLMWFYNFKIRIAKIALSTIRNNPVHALLATLAPQPSLFGTVGLPTDDNMFTKLADGSLWRSLGPAQGFHAASLNPWYNLTQ